LEVGQERVAGAPGRPFSLSIFKPCYEKRYLLRFENPIKLPPLTESLPPYAILVVLILATTRLSSVKPKSLLDGLEGVLVHGHWRPYYQVPAVKHALYNQHHLRKLKALVEHDKET